MDSKRTAYEELQQHLNAARSLLKAGQLGAAEATLREAALLDPVAPQPVELLAKVLEAQGHSAESAKLALRAKALRKQAWARQVEADVRGHHALMGTAIQHETI